MGTKPQTVKAKGKVGTPSSIGNRDNSVLAPRWEDAQYFQHWRDSFPWTRLWRGWVECQGLELGWPYLYLKSFSIGYYPVTDNILSLVHISHQKPTKKRSQHTLINAQPNWRKRPHRSQVMAPHIYDLSPNVEDNLSSCFYYRILESLKNRITEKKGLGEPHPQNPAVDVSIGFQVYKTIWLHLWHSRKRPSTVRWNEEKAHTCALREGWKIPLLWPVEYWRNSHVIAPTHFWLRLSTFGDICVLVLAIVANLCRRQMHDYEVMGLRCVGWMEYAKMKLQRL